MADHVDGLGEALEDLAVAIAEDQLGAVPEGVGVVTVVVDGHHDLGTPAVVGVAAVDLLEEGQRAGDAGRGLVDALVTRLRLTRGAHLLPGEVGAVAGRVDGPVPRLGSRPAGLGGGHLGEDPGQVLRPGGTETVVLVETTGVEPLHQVGGHDVADVFPRSHGFSQASSPDAGQGGRGG